MGPSAVPVVKIFAAPGDVEDLLRLRSFVPRKSDGRSGDSGLGLRADAPGGLLQL